jgi:subtilisin family serine protease
MKKKIFNIGITIVILALVGGGIFLYYTKEKYDPKNWGINPEKLSSVVTDEELVKHHSDFMSTFGFIKKDASQKDLSRVSIEGISNISFDEITKWPEESKLPKGFNPNTWFNVGKDPGLNLCKIHEKGITGKGISVAVIDKPIRSTHNEFKDKMTYTIIDNTNEANPHFHGLACASILAGRTCGVAKEAKLYYFSTPDVGEDRHIGYIDAINKIIEMNKSLSKEEKIRIVSISDGIGEKDKNYSKWQETIKKANSEGLTVVYSNLLGQKNFTWGGCDPSKDRNNPSNYKISNYLRDANIDKSKIIVPGDFRTTASNDGDNSYVYWGEGGFSWAIPYVTGLAALAWQVDPNLTFDQIIDKLIETKTTTAEGRDIIDPEKFISSIH